MQTNINHPLATQAISKKLRWQNTARELVQFCRDVEASAAFHNFILAIIILAGILVGLDTSKVFVEQYGYALNTLGNLVLWIFILEIIIKIAARGRRPLTYLEDPWNVFDFVIVALSIAEPILPINASFIPVLRLARILRVLRLLTVIPDLRLLVGTLLRSISSIGYIGIFLLLLFYMFGTAGVFIFGDNDPVHFRNLPTAMLSLYRIVTLEDWTDVMYINMYGCAEYGYDGNEAICTDSYGSPLGSAIFFVTFVLLGTMIVLNLFIGVVLNSMEQVNAERSLETLAKKRRSDNTSIADEIQIIQSQISNLNSQLELLNHRLHVEVHELVEVPQQQNSKRNSTKRRMLP